VRRILAATYKGQHIQFGLYAEARSEFIPGIFDDTRIEDVEKL
jgi:hypothetical protein